MWTDVLEVVERVSATQDARSDVIDVAGRTIAAVALADAARAPAHRCGGSTLEAGAEAVGPNAG